MKIANTCQNCQKSFNIVKNSACSFILPQLNIFLEATWQTYYTWNITARPILIMLNSYKLKKHDDNYIVRFETCSYIHRY